MTTFSLLSATLLLLPGGAAAYNATRASFDAWRARYPGAVPPGTADDVLDAAFDTWRDNLRRVETHNADPTHTYRMALNAHAAMTHEEYRAFRLRPRPAGQQATTTAAGTENANTFTSASAAPPDTVNWVHQGVIPPIKDQGQCGSCWAFSAVSAMEGAFNLKHHQQQSMPASCGSQRCGPQNASCCSFSEQEVADCTLNGADTCDIGGEPHDGILEVVGRGGNISTEAGYPYVSGKTQRLTPCRPSSTSFVDTGITGYTNVTSGDEAALQAASATHPSISVGIDASSFGFQL